jgi:hypothetical protein
MLTRERITELFEQLNVLLRARGEVGEVGIVGGAVMCLVYNARAATKDVVRKLNSYSRSYLVLSSEL